MVGEGFTWHAEMVGHKRYGGELDMVDNAEMSGKSDLVGKLIWWSRVRWWARRDGRYG